jgi:hypothetical protein
MHKSDILIILSPLVLFFAHVVYLVALSEEQFFDKWIDGSFTFFVALVLCNIIRARVVARAHKDGQPDDPTRDE